MPSSSTPTTHTPAVPETTGTSPSAYETSFETPTTAEAADAILAAAARAVRNVDARSPLARELARFLGASSRVWSFARRERLRSLLLACRNEGLRATLVAVAECPVPEVMDEAELVIESLVSEACELLTGIVDGRPISTPGFQTLASSPAVRAAIVRALAVAGPSTTTPALVRALQDEAAEVRDAAAQGLARRGDPGTKVELQHRLRSEPDAVVRESLEAALQELNANA
jgi:hypothetical protein